MLFNLAVLMLRSVFVLLELTVFVDGVGVAFGIDCWCTPGVGRGIGASGQ